jgi:hypothetical protein
MINSWVLPLGGRAEYERTGVQGDEPTADRRSFSYGVQFSGSRRAVMSSLRPEGGVIAGGPS